MEANIKLMGFIQPYDKRIQELTIQLRDYVVNLVPEANELIWDNYNAVAMAYSKSEKLKDAFCHISVYAKHVNFGFNRGTELKHNSVKLEGKGKLIRHISLTAFESFPKEAMEKMIWDAVEISEKYNADLREKQTTGKSLVMSVSEKKIRPMN